MQVEHWVEGQISHVEVIADNPEDVTKTTVEDRLRNDLATVDTITSTPLADVTGTTVAEVRSSAQSTIRDLQRQVKDLARMNKRLIRLALRAFDSPD